MSNSIFLFRVYLAIVFLFLSFFSLVLSKDLFFLIRKRFQIFTLSIMLYKAFSKEFYIILSNLYLERKNFFLVICLSEFVSDFSYSYMIKDISYSFLAYSYFKSSFFNIAEYYYWKALNLSPYNCDIMFALSKMYYEIGDNSKVKTLCNSIKSVDPEYDLSFFSFD